MGRGKKSGGGNRKQGQKSPAQYCSGQGTYVVDKQLIPRIDNYAAHHSLEDVDTVADALRAAYKEYQRRPLSAFKQMVQKAINAIHARGMASRQVRHADEQHAAKKGGSRDSREAKEGSSGSGGSDSDLSESEDDSSSDSSGSEEGFESGEGSGEAAASGAGARAMNASLLSMYSRPAMAASADESHQAGPGPGSTAQHTTLTQAARSRDNPTKGTNPATAGPSANAGGVPNSSGVGPKPAVTGGKRRRSSPQSGWGSSPPPAFAPPEVVAAAACRALASEKQAKLGSKQADGVSGIGRSSDPHSQQQQHQQTRCGAEGGRGREARAASVGQDGMIGLSTGPKPYLVLPPVDVPAASHPQQQSSQQLSNIQQQNNIQQNNNQQQNNIQQNNSQQQDQPLQSHPHATVPPADAGVAAAVAAAMAAAAAASTGTATKPSHPSAAVDRLGGGHPGVAEQAAASGAGGVDGGPDAGGDAMEEDGREEEGAGRGEGGGSLGQSAGQGLGVAATTPAAKTGGNGGRPTASKKARRAAPTPAKPQGGGRSGGQSAVTVARAVSYADLGGVEDVLSEIRELIEYPLKHPEVYAWLGVEPPRGVLLHGPPGCGKTALANAIANECGVPFLRVSAPEIVSGMSGESEAKLRSLFQEAADVAPCIVFIDEIDAIAPKRENAQREMERRIVAQMLTCMDDLTAPPPASKDGEIQDREAVPICSKHVVVIGASNRPDSLDPALRRAGRFDREIALGIPSEAARTKILQVITQRLRLEGNFDFKKVAKRTPGFVGADLMALVKEAAALAVTRIFSSIDDIRPPNSSVHTADAPPPTQHALMAGHAAHADTHYAAGNGTLGQLPAAAAPKPPPAAPTRAAPGTAPGAAAAGAAAGSVGGASAAVASTEGAADMAIDDSSAPAAPTGAVTGAACSTMPEAPMHGNSFEETADKRQVNGSGGAQCPTAGCKAEPISSRRFGQGPLQAHELQGLAITMSDFEAAVSKVQPNVRREGFATTPDVTWGDVGSLDEVREELSFCITQPVMHPERFQALGLSSATGVLLYGPPGCGKTLVAKAVAHESGANFMSIKGPELLNKYVGESERAVRQLFSRARAAHPCVLFFDELDALAPRRGTDNNQAAERVVNQLLTEMDGIDGRLGVFLVAATNRPDMIDPALLRPGRLDKILYVPLPPPDGRAAILKALVRNTPLAPGVDIQSIGMSARCSGFSGADMAALVREACVLALKESMRTAARTTTGSSSVIPGSKGSSDGDKPSVHNRHFEEALGRVVPSVSRKDQRCYDALRSRLRSSRGRLDVAEDTGAGAATGGQTTGAPAVDKNLDPSPLAGEREQAANPRNDADSSHHNAERDNAEPLLAAS